MQNRKRGSSQEVTSGMDRRDFLKTVGTAVVGTAALGFSFGCVPQYDTKDLAERIREFRGISYYPSIEEYVETLNIQPLTADPEISDFLKREDIVTHINEFSDTYNIPSYLYAAIIAEEGTPTGFRDELRNGIFEDVKSRLGYDTSITPSNVKMSIGAYYLEEIDSPSSEKFKELSREKKEQIRVFLEDEKNNLRIAAQYLRDLKRKFLGWNDKNITSEMRITSEEVDANPLALLQIASGYSGGEDMLHRPPTDKALRVMSILIGNQFIWDLYGSTYPEELQRLNSEKIEENAYRDDLSNVQRLLTNGIELRDNREFISGYQSMDSAITSAMQGAENAKSKNSADWEIEFLAYQAYANAAAARLLTNAIDHNKSGLSDDRDNRRDYNIAIAHYQEALRIYTLIESKGSDISSIYVQPKPIWDKVLPPKQEIRNVIGDIRGQLR